MPDDSFLDRVRAVRIRFSRMLMVWAVASVLVAIAALILGPARPTESSRAMLGAVGAQFFVWGAIDAIFAIIGMSQAGVSQRRDSDNLIRTLRFSARLNYAMLLVGALLLAAGVLLRSPALMGHGVGAIIQVVFLIVFDNLFLRAMQRTAA